MQKKKENKAEELMTKIFIVAFTGIILVVSTALTAKFLQWIF